MTRFVYALLAVMAAFGCASNPLVGTWQMKLSDQQQAQIRQLEQLGGGKQIELPTMSMTFHGDGTCAMTMTMGGKTESAKGTYKMDGNSVTVTPTEANGKKLEGKEAAPATFTLSSDKKTLEGDMGGDKITFVKT